MGITLEVRRREGGVCDLPVERLAPGALARRLRRAEPLADACRCACNRSNKQKLKRVRRERALVDLLRWRTVGAGSAEASDG
jgi:hypothetical protein